MLLCSCLFCRAVQANSLNKLMRKCAGAGGSAEMLACKRVGPSVFFMAKEEGAGKGAAARDVLNTLVGAYVGSFAPPFSAQWETDPWVLGCRYTGTRVRAER